MTSRFRYFVRMNPPINIGSKVGDDAQEFLDCMYKVWSTMRVNSREKAEFSSYQLREVSQVLYNQQKNKGRLS